MGRDAAIIFVIDYLGIKSFLTTDFEKGVTDRVCPIFVASKSLFGAYVVIFLPY